MVHRKGYVRFLSGDRMREWPEVGDKIPSGASVDCDKNSSVRSEFGASFVHVGARSRLNWIADGAFRLESGQVRIHTEAGSPAVAEMGSEKVAVSIADVILVFPDQMKVLAGEVVIKGKTLVAGQTFTLGATDIGTLTERDLIAALSLSLPGSEGASERKTILSFAEQLHIPRLIFDADKVAYEKHIGD